MYFQPQIGRPPKNNRCAPVGEYLYKQKDVKAATIRKLAEEVKKINEVAPFSINKESKEMVEKSMTNILEEIFRALDGGKLNKITSNNCQLDGKAIT